MSTRTMPDATLTDDTRRSVVLPRDRASLDAVVSVAAALGRPCTAAQFTEAVMTTIADRMMIESCRIVAVHDDESRCSDLALPVEIAGLPRVLVLRFVGAPDAVPGRVAVGEALASLLTSFSEPVVGADGSDEVIELRGRVRDLEERMNTLTSLFRLMAGTAESALAAVERHPG